MSDNDALPFLGGITRAVGSLYRKMRHVRHVRHGAGADPIAREVSPPHIRGTAFQFRNGIVCAETKRIAKDRRTAKRRRQ